MARIKMVSSKASKSSEVGPPLNRHYLAKGPQGNITNTHEKISNAPPKIDHMKKQPPETIRIELTAERKNVNRDGDRGRGGGGRRGRGVDLPHCSCVRGRRACTFLLGSWL